MNGVINVLKPPGMTSSDVVVYLRKLLKVKKVGHTGTLDYCATGVLPVCIGNATRLSQFIMSQEKKYRCEMVLGIETDTLDADGKILNTSCNLPDYNTIERVFNKYKGDLKQVPPKYSAKKYKGKRFAEFAKRGEEINIEANKITIYDNKIIKFTPPNKVLFDVECSKGTYIRALCRDIGKELECGAYVSFLLRTKTGVFSLQDSFTLDEIDQYYHENNIDSLLIPSDLSVNHLKSIILDSDVFDKIIHGNQIEVNKVISDFSNINQNEFLRIYCNNKFIGIGILDIKNDKHVVKIKKVFI